MPIVKNGTRPDANPVDLGSDTGEAYAVAVLPDGRVVTNGVDISAIGPYCRGCTYFSARRGGPHTRGAGAGVHAPPASC